MARRDRDEVELTGLERFLRKHKKQLIAGGVGFGLGVLFMRKRYRTYIPASVVNELVKDVFKDAGGDFTKAAGGYLVPQIIEIKG